jgi:hypothetical protein
MFNGDALDLKIGKEFLLEARERNLLKTDQ